jgi:ribosome-binding factor A
MTSARRQRQVAELLHEEISLLIQRRVRDPRLTSVTVTGVEVSPDLQNAWVYVTVMGSTEEAKQALSGLKSAAGFLRREMGASLSLRLVPQLVFRLDESVTRGMRVDQILDNLEIQPEDSAPDDTE